MMTQVKMIISDLTPLERALLGAESPSASEAAAVAVSPTPDKGPQHPVSIPAAGSGRSDNSARGAPSKRTPSRSTDQQLDKARDLQHDGAVSYHVDNASQVSPPVVSPLVARQAPDDHSIAHNRQQPAVQPQQQARAQKQQAQGIAQLPKALQKSSGLQLEQPKQHKQQKQQQQQQQPSGLQQPPQIVGRRQPRWATKPSQVCRL